MKSLDPMPLQILQTLAMHHHKVVIISAWPAMQRAINIALSRMKAAGLIEEHEGSAGDPSRCTYRITDAGRAALVPVARAQ